MKPKALILTGYGINSEEETAYCFDRTGSEAQIIHINDIIENPSLLQKFQILAFPGGFSYGDDTGSGNALANKIKNNLKKEFLKFATEEKLIIGICNGFQILVNLGLAPAINNEYGTPQAALMHNNTTRFTCTWVHLKNQNSNCVWTRNIEMIQLPIAHGEGNFYAPPEIMEELNTNNQITLKYVKEDGTPANGQLPFNPNGSAQDIAAICDPSGRIFGLMPHPERFNCFTNKEGWEKEKEILIRQGKELPKDGDGLKIFANASKYFQ
ncbi:phosphoribosylformylglycinamidine synthase I [Candidatus Peregrinibacteria bacterium]|nr:phosphoribosylformylglycinamidine synthase I [Candidatus Peregrinibacteria bacterium]